VNNYEQFDVIVIGGGFYGCSVAIELKKHFKKVLVVEKEKDLMLHASLINQARVHNGYHYPRNIVTAYRSFVNFPIFTEEFSPCIVNDFTKLYAIAREGSKVNAYQFHNMFKEIGTPVHKASDSYQKLFNPQFIEEVFEVQEYAFDAAILREIMRGKLHLNNVIIKYETEITSITSLENSLVLNISNADSIEGKYVFNCTYSQINKLMKNSNLSLLPMKNELTEMALMEMPDELKNIGITVMDGPFFSCMPYPSEKLHSLSHVRYTPHFNWIDQEHYMDGHKILKDSLLESNYMYMVKDSQRYMPLLSEAVYQKSIFEIKTVLLQNEDDDGRPILYREDYGYKNLFNIMGGKIDNIYDILNRIQETNRFTSNSNTLGVLT